MTGAEQDWHISSLSAKSTTSNGTYNSYVKCGPRISKVLRLKKMTLQKMTLKWQGRTQGISLVSMRIRLRKSCVLPMRRVWNNTESQQHQDMSNQRRSIKWRSGWKKNRFCTCLMTSSVRKTSFSIGLGVCQDTLMLTTRTLTSLGCGDSSMVALHLEAEVAYGGKSLVGGRVWRRWLSHGLTQCL